MSTVDITPKTPVQYDYNRNWTVSGGLRYYPSFKPYLENIWENPCTVNGEPIYVHKFIDSIHDCPPGLIWQGGRCISGGSITKEEYIERAKWYNDRGIGVYLIFSNRLLEEKHLGDRDGNFYLEQLNNPINGVIIGCDTMRDYIKNNFPLYKKKASIGLLRQDYTQLLQEYDTVILNADNNRDYDLIESLPKARVEVLVNEGCIKYCPYRQDHFDKISLYNLGQAEGGGKCIPLEKGEKVGGLLAPPYEVDNYYERGLRNFKLAGREVHAEYMISQMEQYIHEPLLKQIGVTP